MIVISMTDCPGGLRGDLTKWLLEISPGVFVGQVSARVRDQVWDRIKEMVKEGKVTMVFSTNNEQRLDFRVHNSVWEPIDFDGIKLMLRPSPSRIKHLGELRLGFSKASKRQMAKHSAQKRGQSYPDSYVVIDFETSGIHPEEHDIIEMGAIVVKEHNITERFSVLVQPTSEISSKIEGLTGISNEMLQREGEPLAAALQSFLKFIGDLPVISHNVEFDYGFLHRACIKCNLPMIRNRCIDTLAIARRKIKQVDNFKLGTLTAYFGITSTQTHRSLDDCELTYQLFEKLINLPVNES